MAFNSTEKLNQSVKLAQQILDGANDSPGAKWWYNAQRAWEPYAKPGWIEKDSIPGADNITEADAAVADNPTILEKLNVRLTLDITSNDRQYECRSVYGDMSSTTVENWIQPSLIRKNGAASNGYIVKLYHGDPDSGGTEISTTYNSGTGGEPCWWFAYASGILLISSDQASVFKTFYNTNGLYVVGYRYIGLTVADGTYGNEVKVSSNDDSSGFLENKIVAGSGLAVTVLNEGENEQLEVSASASILHTLCTISDIVMAVDYVNGIVPPAGTIVRSQAEYDALGGSLKYLQDALNLLPLYLEHWVTINLVAGTHYAKPDTGGSVSPAMLTMPVFLSRGANYRSGSYPTFPGIVIEGQLTTEEEGVAGTLTNHTFVRSSGTWVAGALIGKRLQLTSGASSGNELVIYDNTEDTVYFNKRMSAVGATVGNIVTLGSILLPNNGSKNTSRGLALSGSVAVTGTSRQMLTFSHVEIGSAVCGLPNSLSGGASVNFRFSKMFLQGTFVWGHYGNSSQVMYDSVIEYVGGGLFCQYAGQFYIYDTLMLGSPRTSMGYLCGGDRPSASVDLLCSNLIIRVAPTYTQTVIRMYSGAHLSFMSYSRIIGNGQCVGIFVSPSTSHSHAPKVTFYKSAYDTPAIKDCLTAIAVSSLYEALYFDLLDVSESTGNTNGYVVSGGAKVMLYNPSCLSATNEITLDGEVFAYSDLEEVGDVIVGRYGSSVGLASKMY